MQYKFVPLLGLAVWLGASPLRAQPAPDDAQIQRGKYLKWEH